MDKFRSLQLGGGMHCHTPLNVPFSFWLNWCMNYSVERILKLVITQIQCLCFFSIFADQLWSNLTDISEGKIKVLPQGSILGLLLLLLKYAFAIFFRWCFWILKHGTCRLEPPWKKWYDMRILFCSNSEGKIWWKVFNTKFQDGNLVIL